MGTGAFINLRRPIASLMGEDLHEAFMRLARHWEKSKKGGKSKEQIAFIQCLSTEQWTSLTEDRLSSMMAFFSVEARKDAFEVFLDARPGGWSASELDAAMGETCRFGFTADNVKALLARGASASMQVPGGGSLLHAVLANPYGAQEGVAMQIARVLVGAGAKPLLQDHKGDLPLHIAIAKGYPRLSLFLGGEGGWGVVNQKGETPELLLAQMARSSKMKEAWGGVIALVERKALENATPQAGALSSRSRL